MAAEITVNIVPAIKSLGLDVSVLDELEIGKDLYKQIAAACYGIPYEEVTEHQRSEIKRKLYFYMYSRPLKR